MSAEQDHPDIFYVSDETVHHLFLDVPHVLPPFGGSVGSFNGEGISPEGDRGLGVQSVVGGQSLDIVSDSNTAVTPHSPDTRG